MKVNVGNLAEIAFNAYNEKAGGKTWDGKDIPPWEELTDAVRANWIAAAKAVADSLSAGLELNDEERAIISSAIQYNKAVKDSSINRMTVIARLAAAVGIRR